MEQGQGGHEAGQESVRWASRDIGNFMDGSKNVVIAQVQMNGNYRKYNNKNGRESKKVPSNGQQYNNYDSSNTGRALSDMVDDFGNPLLPKREKPKHSYNFNSRSSKQGQYEDEFGNPLMRGADDNELAGYRQIREISAVTREILDAHIREKKKEAIEKAARVTPQARIARQLYMQQEKRDDGESGDDGNSMPSFLR